MQPQVQDKVDENLLQDKVDAKPIQDQQTQKQPEAKETEDQINWKKFREQREIERKQAEEVSKKAIEKEAEVQALKAAMDAILNKPSSNTVSNDQYEEETEDQKIDKKVQAALELAERRRMENQRKHEAETFPQRLVENYKDFNQVCTTENLDYLDYHYPEVARAFRHAPDGFDKWSDIYKAVKRFVPNTDSKKDQKKAEANFNKPQSISNIGASPMGKTGTPHILDESKKAANWERMQKQMKGLT